MVFEPPKRLEPLPKWIERHVRLPAGPGRADFLFWRN